MAFQQDWVCVLFSYFDLDPSRNIKMDTVVIMNIFEKGLLQESSQTCGKSLVRSRGKAWFIFTERHMPKLCKLITWDSLPSDWHLSPTTSQLLAVLYI